MLHYDFSFFTFIDRPASPVPFELQLLEAPNNIDFWDIALGNRRKALSSQNPSEKFVNLFLAVEGIRASIKKILNIDFTKEKVKIESTLYTESVIRNCELNLKDFYFVGLDNKDFYYAPYNEDSPLRKMRNETAHVIRFNGRYRLNTNLNDYLDYQKGIAYLDYMFNEQMIKLSELYQLLK